MMQQIYYDFIKHFMCFPEFSEQLFYLFEFSSIFLNFLDFSMGKQFPSSQIRRGDHQPAGEGVPQGWERQVFPRGGSLAPGHHPLVAKLALKVAEAPNQYILPRINDFVQQSEKK